MESLLPFGLGLVVGGAVVWVRYQWIKSEIVDKNWPNPSA